MPHYLKYLFFTATLSCLFSFPGFAFETPEAGQKVGGSIPVIRRVSVDEGGIADLFSSIDAEDFRAGYKRPGKESACITVVANAPWKVGVKAAFKPLETYTKPASDLLIKIRDKQNFTADAGSGGTFDAVFMDFAPLSDTAQSLWMDDAGGDHCQARIDYKILLSPAQDVPGTYAVTVTYTIGAP